MSQTFYNIYSKGLQDEQVVKTHLSNTGKSVTASTPDQDKFEDIDGFVDLVPTSIKTQHAGATYGNIGMELTQQLTTHIGCATTRSILANRDITLKDIARLEAVGSWEKSWFYNGKADQYYIYIGEVLRCYKKKDIVAHVEQYGFKRIRPLKPATKAIIPGKYRYCNSICGYLDINAVKHTKELVTFSHPNITIVTSGGTFGTFGPH